jgi:hypothetical protein
MKIIWDNVRYYAIIWDTNKHQSPFQYLFYGVKGGMSGPVYAYKAPQYPPAHVYVQKCSAGTTYARLCVNSQQVTRRQMLIVRHSVSACVRGVVAGLTPLHSAVGTCARCCVLSMYSHGYAWTDVL